MKNKFVYVFSYTIFIIYINFIHAFLTNKGNYVNPLQYIQYSENLSNSAASVFYYVILGIFLLIQFFVLLARHLDLKKEYLKETKIPRNFIYLPLIVSLPLLLPITISYFQKNVEGALFFAMLAFISALSFQILHGVINVLEFAYDFKRFFITVILLVVVIYLQKVVFYYINGFIVSSTLFWIVFELFMKFAKSSQHRS